MLLLNCQALFIFILKFFDFFVVRISAATFILYQISVDLSTTFLFFLIFSFNQCPCFRGETYNITLQSDRQAFFLLFSIFFVYIYFHVFRGYIFVFSLSLENPCINRFPDLYPITRSRHFLW